METKFAPREVAEKVRKKLDDLSTTHNDEYRDLVLLISKTVELLAMMKDSNVPKDFVRRASMNLFEEHMTLLLHFYNAKHSDKQITFGELLAQEISLRQYGNQLLGLSDHIDPMNVH